MAPSSQRIKRGADWIPRSSFAMASAPAPACHPAEIAPHPSKLHNPLLYSVDRHPLLKPEIIAIVFSYLGNDDDDDDDEYKALWTMAQCTELRDLLFYVQDPIRRRHHAAFVKELDFKLDDTILSTTRMFLSFLERIHSIKYLDLGDVGEDLAREFPREFLIQLFNKPRFGYLSFPHAVELSQSTVDTFLAAMGRRWTFPTRYPLGKPQFDSGTTAARFISRMSNLERLWLSIGPWQIDLEHVFTVIAMLEELEYLELELKMRACNIDGSWLLKLIGLTCFQSFRLEVGDPGTISLTGTQLANFLVGLSHLDYLSLSLGALEVSCLPEEKTTIESALANIETTWLQHMAFTTHNLL
ncbi:hypothetical protein KCU78_g299, partial [Aureobasidium melanogenum]